jgi:hypothetical protein
MPRVMRNLLAVVLLAVSAVTFTALAQAQAPAPTPTPQPTITPDPAPTVSAEEQAKQERLLKQQKHQLRKQIQHDQKATWRWQDVMLKRRTHPAKPVAYISSLNWLQHSAKYWHKSKLRARYKAHHPPYLSAWLCIHRHEGPWNAATGNGYYGGLQMDATFMGMYGASLVLLKGYANNWTPLEQIWVAVNAAFRHGRGFHPWPKTARMCGLI